MDIVAISDGNAVIVNQPYVKELGTDESFSTQSTLDSCENEESEIEAVNPLPNGPLSRFRRRRAEQISAQLANRQEKEEEEERRPEDKQKKINEAIPEGMIDPDSKNLRAGIISVTVVKSESISYGLGLVQVPRKKNSVKIDALVNDGLLHGSPLREGDTLKSVNNEAVTDYRSVMLQLMNMNGAVTISVETPAQNSNPALIHAFCRKPTPDTLLGIEFEVAEHWTTQKDLAGDPEISQEVSPSSLLQIKSIRPGGFLASSALNPGDIVLAINGVACAQISSEDASLMITESESSVDLLVLNPKLAQEHCSPTRVQRWMRRVRRTGVGAVGGTMRELLVVGGVSVLGTEFEAPKRVIRNARNALQNTVESKKNEGVEVDKLRQMESVADDKYSADETKTELDCDVENPVDDLKEPVVLRESFLTVMSQQQLDQDHSHVNESSSCAPTISDCWSDSNINANIDNMYSGDAHVDSSSSSPAKEFFQNVGRNVFLPLLDHVVGDKKEHNGSEKKEFKLKISVDDSDNKDGKQT